MVQPNIPNECGKREKKTDPIVGDRGDSKENAIVIFDPPKREYEGRGSKECPVVIPDRENGNERKAITETRTVVAATPTAKSSKVCQYLGCTKQKKNNNKKKMEMKTKKPKKEEGISSTHAQKPCSSLQQRHSQDYHYHGMKRGCQQQHIERGGIQGRCGTHCGFPKCSREGCDSKQSYETGDKRGFCGKHGGIPPSKVEGCNSIQHYRTGGIKGFCGKHGGVPQRYKSCGSFERTKRKRQDGEREDSGDKTKSGISRVSNKGKEGNEREQKGRAKKRQKKTFAVSDPIMEKEQKKQEIKQNKKCLPPPPPPRSSLLGPLTCASRVASTLASATTGNSTRGRCGNGVGREAAAIDWRKMSGTFNDHDFTYTVGKPNPYVKDTPVYFLNVNGNLCENNIESHLKNKLKQYSSQTGFKHFVNNELERARKHYMTLKWRYTSEELRRRCRRRVVQRRRMKVKK
eukprot:jgi/Bigna1/85997/estExt_fgenesh1_pg.C_70222